MGQGGRRIRRENSNHKCQILYVVGVKPEAADFLMQYAHGTGIIYHGYMAKIVFEWIRQISCTFSVPYRVSS